MTVMSPPAVPQHALHLRRSVCAVILTAMTIAAQAAEVRLTSTPPLPPQNLLRNAAVEQGTDGVPLAWRFGTAVPDNFETAWRGDGRSGKCLWMRAASGKMSGYWSQTVRVQPGRSFLLHGFYRLGGGRILLYVHGRGRVAGGKAVSVDERFYAGSLRGHWLSPVFLPPEALAGPDPKEWIPFRLPVTIPEGIEAVAVSLGIYFTPGEVSFDDLWFGRATAELTLEVELKAGEAIRRVVVRREGESRPLCDQYPQPAATHKWRFVDQPVDGRYRAEVTLADGRTIAATYPERGGQP